MHYAQPIWIICGADNWQVFARNGDFAVIHLRGGVRSSDAPGSIFVRVVSEQDGHPVVSWRCAQRSEDTWQLTLEIPTGGPYRLETCAKTPQQEFKDAVGGELRLHLFVGDLYLIAGQSNAVGYARDEVSDPPCIGVSVFRLNGRWDMASHPLNDGTDCIWANRDVPMPAHSPWLTFAKILYRKTGVPIGLLPAALGGSPMDAWVPGGMLYRNAVEFVQRGGIPKGVLWYQGSADAIAGNAKDYRPCFMNMVEAFRREIGVLQLPFFTCQLNGFTEPGTSEDDAAWAALREQQRLCAEADGIFMLPTAGMKLCDQIHNCAQSNVLIGRQIAAQVLRNLYGQDVRWESPAVADVYRGRGRLELHIGQVSSGLRMKRTSKIAFLAYAGDRRLDISKCTAQFDRIILEGKDLGDADLLMYAQTKDLTGAGIFDRDGDWALAPFVFRLKD